MGLEWEYEVEGFTLPSGAWYLPDFKVKSVSGSYRWYEVKPRGITQDNKAEEFATTLGEVDHWLNEQFPGNGREDKETYALLLVRDSLEILSGDPLDYFTKAQESGMCPVCGSLGDSSRFDEVRVDEDECCTSAVCMTCWNSLDSWDEQDYMGVTGCRVTLTGGTAGGPGGHRIRNNEARRLRKSLMNAAVAARSARFEHGQTPVFV